MVSLEMIAYMILMVRIYRNVLQRRIHQMEMEVQQNREEIGVLTLQM